MNNEDIDINGIISKCKVDDRSAQEKLYRSFYSAMMAICMRYTQNETDALEVLNTGFLKVFKNIHRYEPAKASLYTWIRAIIINSCINFLKSKQKNIPSQESIESVEINIPPDVISKMGSAEILQLIRQLPPATKTVFNMFVIDGYTHVEIGMRLNISEGTSKWHLSEARKILQQKIKQTRANE